MLDSFADQLIAVKMHRIAVFVVDGTPKRMILSINTICLRHMTILIDIIVLRKIEINSFRSITWLPVSRR